MLSDFKDFTSVYNERGKRYFQNERFVAVLENHHARGSLPKWQVWIGSGDRTTLENDKRFPYGFQHSASVFTGTQSEAYKRAEMLACAVVIFGGFDRNK